MSTTVRIAVVFHSGYGHTAKQAQAVARGAADVPGATVDIRALEDGNAVAARSTGCTGWRWANTAGGTPPPAPRRTSTDSGRSPARWPVRRRRVPRPRAARKRPGHRRGARPTRR